MKKHRDYSLPRYAQERQRFLQVRHTDALSFSCFTNMRVDSNLSLRVSQLAVASMDEMERLKDGINARAALAHEGQTARSLASVLPPSLSVPSQPPPRSWEPAVPDAVAALASRVERLGHGGDDGGIPPLPPPSGYKPRAASQATLARHALMPTPSAGSDGAYNSSPAVPPPAAAVPQVQAPSPGTLMEAFNDSYSRHSGATSASEVPGTVFLDVLDDASQRSVVVPSTRVTVPAADDARADHTRLQARLRVYGMREKTVAGDGNCQFRALADQLFRDAGRHSEVRARVIAQLRGDTDAYAVFVTEPYDEYLHRMAQNGTWGDHLTLQAAADAYGCRICLLTSYKDSFVVDITPRNVTEPHQTLWLSFFAEVHYNSCYKA